MWFNFAIESSPFRQVPSLGCSHVVLDGCSLVETVVWDSGNHRKLLWLCAGVGSCTSVTGPGSICLQPFSFQTLLSSAVLNCTSMAVLAEPTALCIDRICAIPKGMWIKEASPAAGQGLTSPLAELSWSSSRSQSDLAVLHGLQVADSFLQLCNRSSHDEVHINYFKVEWKHCENIPRVVVCPLWGHRHLH